MGSGRVIGCRERRAGWDSLSLSMRKSGEVSIKVQYIYSP